MAGTHRRISGGVTAGGTLLGLGTPTLVEVLPRSQSHKARPMCEICVEGVVWGLGMCELERLGIDSVALSEIRRLGYMSAVAGAYSNHCTEGQSAKNTKKKSNFKNL